MRPSEIEHLKTLVEQKRSFKLIPYGSENTLSFEMRKGWWKITCLYMNIFPDVAMTGEMDLKRVKRLLPKMEKYARKKDAYLEVLSHPGRVLPEELSDEYGPDDRKAFLSPNRDTEYETFTEIRKAGR